MPRNKYPEETVKKILDASLKLFLEKGFEQTTVLDIVDNLGGLTRGAFYHHFKSKDEVLVAVFERYFSEHNPFKKAKEMEAANGLERAKIALRIGLNSNIANEENISMTKLAIPLLSNPRFIAEIIKSNQEDSKDFAIIIEEGMADGSIRPGNAKIIAELFFLLSNFWMYPGLFPCSKEESIAKAEMTKEIFDALGFYVLDNELGEMYFRVLSTFDTAD